MVCCPVIARGCRSLLRPLAIVVLFSVLLFPLVLPVVPLFAQGTLGERLTDFDINTLPGTGNKSARGVCSDGETLWVVEERALKLFAYVLAGDVPTRDVDGDIQLDFYENYGPSGCAADGTTIWVADDEFDKLIAYDIASKARDGDSDIDTLGAAGNNRVGDVALHGCDGMGGRTRRTRRCTRTNCKAGLGTATRTLPCTRRT